MINQYMKMYTGINTDFKFDLELSMNSKKSLYMEPFLETINRGD